MVQETALRATLDRIHGAALDPGRWSGAVSAIVGLCGAQSGIVYEYDRVRQTSATMGSPGIDPAMMRRYEEHYYALDPWNGHAMTARVGSVGLTHEIMPDEEFGRSEFYHDHCRLAGIFYSMGSVVDRSTDHMVVFGVQRGHRRGPFARETAEMVERFITPHLRQACLAQRAIQAGARQCTTLAETLHLIPSPVLVVDGAGRLCFANLTAETLLAANDGLRLSRGTVTASSRDQTKLFAEALANLARGLDGAGAPGRDLAIDRPNADRPHVLRLLPLPRGTAGDGPCIAIFIDIASSTAQGMERLRHALRLTAAEARLLSGLVAGESLQALSDKHHVSVNTLRVQLNRLFQKTGTHRQAELVRFALTAGAVSRLDRAVPHR